MKIYQNKGVYDVIILGRMLGKTDADISDVLTSKLQREVSRLRVNRIRKNKKYQARVVELHDLLVHVLGLGKDDGGD